MEIWKEIIGGNGQYLVSDKGRIKSIGRHIIHMGRRMFYKEKILTPAKMPTGYLTICLHSRHGNKTPIIHRLVAEMFIDNPENLPCVNHKNGIKNDNRAENLEWVTYQQNTDHAIKTGLMNNNGQRCKTSVLNDDNVREIKQILKTGGWGTVTALAKKFNVTPTTISYIKNNRWWKNII